MKFVDPLNDIPLSCRKLTWEPRPLNYVHVTNVLHSAVSGMLIHVWGFFTWRSIFSLVNVNGIFWEEELYLYMWMNVYFSLLFWIQQTPVEKRLRTFKQHQPLKNNKTEESKHAETESTENETGKSLSKNLLKKVKPVTLSTLCK